MAPHRARLGLDPDREAASLRAAPYLTLAPPSLDDPEVVPEAQRFREAEPDPAPLPDWWSGAGEPLVYLTLGSVAASMGYFPGVYRAAIESLAPLARPRARDHRARRGPVGARPAPG